MLDNSLSMTPKNVCNFPLSLQLTYEACVAHPYHFDIGSPPPPRPAN